MASTVSHLVLATMLVHSMLGCCVHHAHRDAGDAPRSSIAGRVQDSLHAHGPQHCPSQTDPGEHHPPGRSCQGETCLFLRQTTGPTSQQFRTLLAVPRCELGGHVALPAPLDNRPHPVATLFAEHVRLHLAKRLLLI